MDNKETWEESQYSLSYSLQESCRQGPARQGRGQAVRAGDQEGRGRLRSLRAKGAAGAAKTWGAGAPRPRVHAGIWRPYAAPGDPAAVCHSQAAATRPWEKSPAAAPSPAPSAAGPASSPSSPRPARDPLRGGGSSWRAWPRDGAVLVKALGLG